MNLGKERERGKTQKWLQGGEKVEEEQDERGNE